MIIVLVCLGWLAVAAVLALVIGSGISLADERAEIDAWRVPLLQEPEVVGATLPGPLADR